MKLLQKPWRGNARSQLLFCFIILQLPYGGKFLIKAPEEDLSQNLLWKPEYLSWEFSLWKSKPPTLPTALLRTQILFTERWTSTLPKLLRVWRNNKIMHQSPAILGCFPEGKVKLGRGEEGRTFVASGLLISENHRMVWVGKDQAAQKIRIFWFVFFFFNPDPWSHFPTHKPRLISVSQTHTFPRIIFPSPLLQGHPEFQNQLKLSPNPAQPSSSAGFTLSSWLTLQSALPK